MCMNTHRVPACLCVCLPACTPVCTPACTPERLHTCLSVCLSVCLSICLSVCLSLSACLPVCLPAACLYACLYTCMPACLYACAPAHLHACLRQGRVRALVDCARIAARGGRLWWTAVTCIAVVMDRHDLRTQPWPAECQGSRWYTKGRSLGRRRSRFREGRKGKKVAPVS